MAKLSLRRKILAFVSALIMVSLFGSSISLYRITEVNRSLDSINQISVPLGRLFTQIQADSEIFRREADRRLGYSHWHEAHWKARPIPAWVEEVLANEFQRADQLISKEMPWSTPEMRSRLQQWIQSVSQQFDSLKSGSLQLFQALDKSDEESASRLYPQWSAGLEEWSRQIQWGTDEYERSLRQTFSLAEKRVSELRTGLEIILVVVLSLSLLLLWLSERALRPLGDLIFLVRDIARRGLRKEDKAKLPEIPLTRNDEVSQLAREFHHMATALLEREKTVDTQQHRLQEQNKLLKSMGELNESVLKSIRSILVVSDLEGVITQCNPVAAAWLGADLRAILGTQVSRWKKLQAILGSRVKSESKIDGVKIDGRVFGGSILPLLQEDGKSAGEILVLDDLTDEIELQSRLKQAEHLAAVGRMSAQVAHEVRNPLHSIGLEAEMAAEMVTKLTAQSATPALKQSIQSILAGVDRLEKITENYLRLSKLSSGKREAIDLGEVLESVLATYAPICESQSITVDWKRESGSSLKINADPDLLEQVLGNLFKNAIQALSESRTKSPKIEWSMGSSESGRVWLRIRDNGPGIPQEIQEKLFTPFMTTKAQGTGLGLSFIKRVLDDHGGAIEYVKTTCGACFEIRLQPSSSKDLGDAHALAEEANPAG